MLVTGASAGIGAATAVHFAKFGLNNDLSDFHADDDDSDDFDASERFHLQGCRLSLVARSEDALKEVAERFLKKKTPWFISELWKRVSEVNLP